ncbi:uncharacterized protein ACLA_018170 [Aspergillus clavatus NRRL 1]|uniref:Uncharacterized protein n=1 Tax=Aspergillus clavatus (strain ATCC 1007 / CBS 513.65 / DSM 816 / NCTC 3887 / NRRL 1 / QM 1276 / 107) TaxID=344612 RepID=A1CN92_ASPCL|nr:uncharacterized protein ACLA_018170 [Aspergillus clavatus NRRL 1]EAW07113.1 hypothetical protein ACLA_018170 [Aspergillus clavatus NRRL 1]
MLIQREAYLRETSDNIWEELKELKGRNVIRIRELQKEFQRIEDKLLWISVDYNSFTWTLRRVAEVLEHTPVWRALQRRQSDPKWYLSHWLRSHCAANGGCCERPRNRRCYDGLGHCTVTCGCCERFRGYQIKTEEWTYPGRIYYDVQREKSDLYTGLLLNSYVWGL